MRKKNIATTITNHIKDFYATNYALEILLAELVVFFLLALLGTFRTELYPIGYVPIDIILIHYFFLRWLSVANEFHQERCEAKHNNRKIKKAAIYLLLYYTIYMPFALTALGLLVKYAIDVYWL